MKTNLISSRTCVYNINYHMVWSTKYRARVLSPEIELFMQNEASKIASEYGFTVHLLEVGNRDHVHCFVSAPPKISISTLAKYLKGILARKTFEAFPEIRGDLRKGILWNHSYYVETVGCVSEDQIRRYIEKQTNSY